MRLVPHVKIGYTFFRAMTKKSTSTSNVANTNNNNGNNQLNNTPPKAKNTSKNHFQTGSSGIINSKHLHNQSHQQKPKNKKEAMSNDGINENLLMKKLSEAVQKQKEKEKDFTGAEVKRTRKATAPLPKTLNSSENYAGAAFDRAPAAKSFPIPSFIKTGVSETGSCGPALSSSCPLPSLSESSPTLSNSGSSKLKTLSISDLFKNNKSQEEPEQVKLEEKSEKKKLENLTNDLRRMLNLR
jgi:hypothetical protein